MDCLGLHNKDQLLFRNKKRNFSNYRYTLYIYATECFWHLMKWIIFIWFDIILLTGKTPIRVVFAHSFCKGKCWYCLLVFKCKIFAQWICILINDYWILLNNNFLKADFNYCNLQQAYILIIYLILYVNEHPLPYNIINSHRWIK